MVIFGAGASFDSVSTYTDPRGVPTSDNSWRPPVTKELFGRRFEDVMVNYPRVLDAAAYLQGIATDVEGELDAFREQSARGENERTRLLAEIRYYLQDMITQWQAAWEETAKGRSNYKTLLTAIRRQKELHGETREKTCLVSFNWDTLLESALPRVNVNIREIDDYVLSNYLVIKPHGSSTWGRLVDMVFDSRPPFLKTERGRADEIRAQLLDKLPNVEITDKYELVTGPFTGLSSRQKTPTMPPPLDVVIPSQQQVLFPALAIPILKKYDFECPKDQQQALIECLPQVDKVLIIGWRAAEGYFLEMMRSQIQRDTKFMVVSGPKSAPEVVDSLLRAGVTNTRAEIANGGFTAALASHEIEKFLLT